MNSVLLAILLTGAAPSFEVQTLDGQTLIGPLLELTADRLTVGTRSGSVSLETERLLTVVAKQKAPSRGDPDVVVQLTDGSTIAARQYGVAGNRAKITLSEGDVVEAPTNIVRTVQLQPASDALNAEWQRLINGKLDSDLLVVRKEEGIDYHKCILHDVTEDAVQCDVDGEALSVKRSKIYGFAYYRVETANLPPAVCRITNASGSQWFAQSLTGGKTLQWTTPAGVRVAEAVDRIAEIDFSGGKLVYLSDIKPEIVRWTPFFGASKRLSIMEQFYAPRYDRNFESGALLLGGTQYPKGLALRGSTEIAYRLPDQFSHFRAVAGIDDSVRPGGKVRLVIRGDDTQLLSMAITGNDAPRTIDLDLTGVRRLTILVEFGDSLSPGDYLLLCNARLTR